MYDLEGFGAVPEELEIPEIPIAAAAPPMRTAPAVKPEPPTAKAEDDVMDLATFGAVRLDDDTPGFAAPQGGAEAEIHNLSEFGAVALD